MATGLQMASLAISAAGTGFGIIQAQQQANMQAAQAQQQIDMAAQQRAQQAQMANRQALLQQQGAAKAEQQQKLAYYKNVDNINAGLNRTFVAEQAKVKEARDKAAFKSQAILAKSIGTQGSILAAGQSGQSVGLMSLDADRQAGFATAQQEASIRSAELQGQISMDVAEDQAKSATNRAFSQLSAPTQAPVLDPYGMQGLVIPT